MAHTHTHTCIHTYTHTHIHTQMSELFSLCVRVCVKLEDESEYLGSKDQTVAQETYIELRNTRKENVLYTCTDIRKNMRKTSAHAQCWLVWTHAMKVHLTIGSDSCSPSPEEDRITNSLHGSFSFWRRIRKKSLERQSLSLTKSVRTRL